MRKTWIRFGWGGILATWMAVIFLFSHQPASESSKISGTFSFRLIEQAGELLGLDMAENDIEKMAERIDYPVRKAAHMTEYAILGLLSFGFFFYWWQTEKKYIYYLSAWLFCICYAATDEFHQLFVQGRAGKISDVCIDAAGAAIGLLLLFVFRKILRSHCEKRKYLIQ